MIQIDQAEFQREFFKAAGQEVSNYVRSKRAGIVSQINTIVEQEIRVSPEYLAMLPGGEMYGRIGNPNIAQTLEAVIAVILQNQTIVNMPIVYTANDFLIQFEVFILRTDNYSEFTHLAGAEIVTANGKIVPWLEWLLLRGTQSVVLGYSYAEGAGFTKSSRTGEGIMVKSNVNSFAIPGQYAGDATNNWLTRSINRISQTLFDIIVTGFN